MARILVVDDEPEVARSPDLVITDCRVPGKSGVQLCVEVRRRRPVAGGIP